jgi:hypothetical protein
MLCCPARSSLRASRKFPGARRCGDFWPRPSAASRWVLVGNPLGAPLSGGGEADSHRPRASNPPPQAIVFDRQFLNASGQSARERDQNLRVATATHEEALPWIRFRILQKGGVAVAHPNASARAHETIGQYGGILPVARHRLRPQCPPAGTAGHRSRNADGSVVHRGHWADSQAAAGCQPAP